MLAWARSLGEVEAWGVEGTGCYGAGLARGGNRQANTALYRIVVVRLRWHQPTRDYLVRRTKEGLSKREIIRCLKRYVAREIFAAMNAPTALPDAA